MNSHTSLDNATEYFMTRFEGTTDGLLKRQKYASEFANDIQQNLIQTPLDISVPKGQE